MTREKEFVAVSGWVAVFALLAGGAVLVWLLISGIRDQNPFRIIPAVVALALDGLLPAACSSSTRTRRKVLQLFGKYVGTAHGPGPALGQPVLHQAAHLAARAQLRERAS